MTRFSLALAACLLAAPLAAHDYTLGELKIAHPMAFETRGMVGGGFLAITNTGETPDALIAVRSDVADRIEIHTTDLADGVATMRQIERIEIAPGETIELAPGGLHVMFMGLGGDPFEVGEEIAATLVFETAGEIDVVFTVEARGGMDHSGMDHSGMDHGSDS